ncbi:uncharacterized phosphotransferase YvkC [Trichonephila inaurata madagascariensis]|uniref:Uncharacterized phosphotransferase YvkC n=1 Tax=Trichonephila inaurata madagascariensis TaxID=2747483 RepID=A0A8X6XBL5_9ARAC|nr:uncharacterized phosphotransferase YvkC [Trichonephila inaurata madagascariensis]
MVLRCDLRAHSTDMLVPQLLILTFSQPLYNDCVRTSCLIFLAVTKCWASQFGFIAVEYKRRNGQVLNSPMAVVIQEMVACDVSGVLFTLDPVTSNPSIITITANYGLGETVVSGAVEPDTVVLRRKDNEVLELDSVAVGNKHQKMVMLDSGGTSTVELDENSKTQSCLSREFALRLGELAIKIERYYKCSCDIEWGILDKKIYILQSRPVTTAAATTDYEIKHEFDTPLQCENQYLTVANVGEVMPGAVSTLGLELATKYFNSVIRRIMTTGMVDNLFANKYFLTGMLSFYNHLMMTAAELIIQNGLDTINSKAFMMSTFGRILDDPELFEYAKTKIKKGFKQSFKMTLEYYWDLFTFDFGYKKIRNKIYNHPLSFLKQKTAEETFTAILKSCSDFDDAGMYHIGCSSASSNWNMYLFSILYQSKGSFDTDVYGDFSKLLASSSDVESASIPQAMQEVADQIVKDIGCKKFSSMSVEDAEEWLKTSTSQAGHKFRQFLEKHGHRCIKETDVRSITWGMNPKQLVKLLQNLAAATKEDITKKDDSQDIFSQLRVPLNFISKCLLKFVVPQCRRGIRGREAGKSLSMKSFDSWRKGYLRLGKQMVSEGRLPDADLIFFLRLDEIKDLLNTRSPNLISRANHRRKLFPILNKYKFPEIMKGIPKPINAEEESMDSQEFIADLTMKADSGILSSTVKENHCDLYPCIDDHLMIPVLNSTFVKCIKRSYCGLSDNNVSLFPISQKSLFHLSFKSVSVKQVDDDFLVQLRLSSALSVDFSKEGHQTSLILKISFGKGIACYEFSIPFSFFMYFKDDFVLPCFRIPSSYKHELKLVLFAYWNDPFKSITEILLMQAVKYSLKNVTEVYKFKGNVFKTTYDFDSKNFYLIMNRTVDSQCLFYHNISISESSQDNICNKHKPVVHRWVSFSRKSCDSVSYSRSNFTSSQGNAPMYCIHAVLKKYRDCELLYPDNFIEIFFFQLPGDVYNNSKSETSICDKWNLTMDAKINK